MSENKSLSKGQIRVGKIVYEHGKQIIPSYPNFTPILCLTPSSPYGSIGPYVLKDEKGRIMENIWQFSKVYKRVPYTKEFYSRWNQTEIRKHPSEIHLNKDGKLTDKNWAWRKKGFECKYPVRYPVGFNHRGECLYALEDGKDDKNDSKEKLSYIDARKRIYVPVYTRLVKQQRQYKELVERLNKGENLLIIEIDGPHQEALSYYKEKYGVDDDFIVGSTIVATESNLKIMLNDSKFPFGHGYVLAMALMGMNC